MDFKNILHNKWFLWGGGIVLLLVLYTYLKSSNAAVGNNVVNSTTQGPTDAQVAAQVALAQAQIGAASQANTTNAQLTATQATLQEQLAEKGLDAEIAKYSIDAQVATTNAQLTAASAAQERDDNLQASIAKWTLDQTTALQTANNNFQLAYAAQANSTTIANAQIIAGVNLASIQAQRDLGVASINASVANTATIVNGQVALGDQNAAVQINNSNNQARTAQKQSSNNLIGGIVGGVLGLFSDRRLKREARFIGVNSRGIPVYSYRYHDSRSYQLGVMADDVRRLAPHALGAPVAGYDTVRYAALN